MDDLEICKRIAEIEDTKFLSGEGDKANKIYHVWQHSERYGILLQKEYNPLTNDALCFKLMVKYGLSFYSKGQIVGGKKFGAQVLRINHPALMTDESPNRAICLAIIEANK